MFESMKQLRQSKSLLKQFHNVQYLTALFYRYIHLPNCHVSTDLRTVLTFFLSFHSPMMPVTANKSTGPWITLALFANVLCPLLAFKICAFNVQSFGDSKSADVPVMHTLIRVSANQPICHEAVWEFYVLIILNEFNVMITISVVCIEIDELR